MIHIAAKENLRPSRVCIFVFAVHIRVFLCWLLWTNLYMFDLYFEKIASLYDLLVCVIKEIPQSGDSWQKFIVKSGYADNSAQSWTYYFHFQFSHYRCTLDISVLTGSKHHENKQRMRDILVFQIINFFLFF